MTKYNYVDLWDRCLRIIKDNVPESTYNTWFVPIKPLKYEENERGGILTIEVPTQFFYEFIEEKFLDLMRAALYKGIGKGTQLMYSIAMGNGNALPKAEVADKGTITIPSTTQETSVQPVVADEKRDPRKITDPATLQRNWETYLKADYTFENFIEGTSNKLPRVAAETVAQNPGKTAFNPLFIYGPSGIGKTHLVNAIGNRIMATFPQKKVIYLSAHLFQVQYTNAVRNNTVNDFIGFYQSIDVLIIDDIQEFAGATKTQNTFFHIFNHLHQNGKQLVMTSDRSPVMLQGMEDRLLTRFKWGLLAELERPNTELRKNILKNKMYRDGLKFPEAVIDFVAENVNESVRDLEGVVNALMAYSIVYNKDVDLDLARSVIGRIAKIEEKKQLSIDNIVTKVCAYFDLEPISIQSKSRKREIVMARQIAMYLAKKYTEASSSQIGMQIGKKDHATVLHACKIVKNLLDVDKNLKCQMDEIEQQLA